MNIHHDRAKDEMVKVIHKQFKGYTETDVIRKARPFVASDIPMEPSTYEIVMCTKELIIVHHTDGGMNINGVYRPPTRFITTYHHLRTK